MLSQHTELRAQSVDFDRSFQFLLQDVDLNRGRVAIGTLVQMSSIKDHELVQRPTFALSKQAAQLLLDDLWRAGLRPSNGEGNAGQLGATEKHLEDMRKLTTRLLDEVLRQDAMLVTVEKGPTCKYVPPEMHGTVCQDAP